MKINLKVLNKLINSHIVNIVLVTLVTLLIFCEFILREGFILYIDVGPHTLNMESFKNFSNYAFSEKHLGLTNLDPILPVTQYYVLSKFFNLLGFFDPFILNRIWFVAPYFFFYVIVYFIASGLLKNKFYGLLFTLLTIFSFHNYVLIFWGFNHVMWSISGGVLFIYYVFKYLNKTNYKNALILSVATILGVTNIAYFYYFVLMAIALVVFTFITGKNKVSEILKPRIVIVPTILILLFNAYWILPFTVNSNSAAYTYGSSTDSTFEYASIFTNYVNTFLLKGFEVLPEYRSIFTSYSGTLYLLSSFIAPFVLAGVVGFSTDKKHVKISLILLAMYLLSFTLALGRNSLMADLLELIPGYSFMRVPTRAYVLLFLTPLVSTFVLRKFIRPIYFHTFLGLLLLVNVFFWFRSGIYDKLPNAVLPDDYRNIALYLNDSSRVNSTTMIYPRFPWILRYSWGDKYENPTPLVYLLSNPLILYIGEEGPAVPENLKEVYKDVLPLDEYATKLGTRGVRYIVQHKDYLDSSRTKDMVDIDWEVVPNLNKVYSGNSLYLYEINKDYVTPTIYSSNSSSSLYFEKVSPSEFSVTQNFFDEQLLTLNYPYNNNWRLYPTFACEEHNILKCNNLAKSIHYLSSKSIPRAAKCGTEDANCWKIDHKQGEFLNNTQNLSIIYYPQLFLRVGSFITVVSLLTSVLVFAVQCVRHSNYH